MRNQSYIEKMHDDIVRGNKAYETFFTPAVGNRAWLGAVNALTGRASYLYLGMGNLSSAVINLSQLINLKGYLGETDEWLIKDAMKKAVSKDFTRTELKILRETGVLFDIGLDSGSGYDKNRGVHAKGKSLLLAPVKAIDKIGNESMKLFQYPDGTAE